MRINYHPTTEPFQKIPEATANSTISDPVSTCFKLYPTPHGSRWTWRNVVVKADFPPAFLAELLSIFEARNNGLFESADGDVVSPTALIQPIPENMLKSMQKNGENTFGLTPEDGPFILSSFPTSWTKSQNDDLVYSATRQLIAQVQDKAKQHRVYTPYVYLNYADVQQEVQKDYGPGKYARLVNIAQKYDPEGKLARLWKGHFKLDR